MFSSLPRWLQQPALGQAEARIQQLPLGFSLWIAGIHQPSAACPATLAGSWIRSRVSVIPTDILIWGEIGPNDSLTFCIPTPTLN